MYLNIYYGWVGEKYGKTKQAQKRETVDTSWENFDSETIQFRSATLPI